MNKVGQFCVYITMHKDDVTPPQMSSMMFEDKKE